MKDDVTKFPQRQSVFSFCRNSNRHVRYVLYSSWIPAKPSPPSLVLMLPEKAWHHAQGLLLFCLAHLFCLMRTCWSILVSRAFSLPRKALETRMVLIVLCHSKKQGTPIVFLLNIYLFSRAMFCIYMLILRASFAMHKISCTMQHNDPRNEL